MQNIMIAICWNSVTKSFKTHTHMCDHAHLEMSNPFSSKIPWIKSRITVFENHRKSLIQQYERSELRLHFEWTKVS